MRSGLLPSVSQVLSLVAPTGSRRFAAAFVGNASCAALMSVLCSQTSKPTFILMGPCGSVKPLTSPQLLDLDFQVILGHRRPWTKARGEVNVTTSSTSSRSLGLEYRANVAARSSRARRTLREMPAGEQAQLSVNTSLQPER